MQSLGTKIELLKIHGWKKKTFVIYIRKTHKKCYFDKLIYAYYASIIKTLYKSFVEARWHLIFKLILWLSIC